MFSALNFGATARYRYETSGSELQKLFEISTTTLEDLLSFPNVISEFQGGVNTHGFFSTEKIEKLIAMVFDPVALEKYSFDEARKYAFISSELLMGKTQQLNEYFFHRESSGHHKKSTKVDEIDFENDFEVGKDLLLSPVNSVKSKSANFVEICNRKPISNLISAALREECFEETRAGYLSKILLCFFQKNKNSFLECFYKHDQEYLKFLNFIRYYSITDFLNQVVLFENNISNDSMVFQESQAPISNEYCSIKIDFFVRIITHPDFGVDFEVTNNVKTLIEAFLSKYKNISEAEEFIRSIFIAKNYFQFLKNALDLKTSPAIIYEILAIVRLITNFFIHITNSKVEILNESAKFIFHTDPVHSSLLDLINTIKGLLNQRIRCENVMNTFQQNSNTSSVKVNVCLMDIFSSFIKQTVVPVYECFMSTEFMVTILVV